MNIFFWLREGKEEWDEKLAQQEICVRTWKEPIYMYENRFRFKTVHWERCVFPNQPVFLVFLTISRNDTVGRLRNFGDYEYWSWIWSLERYHNKIIRTACMNVGGEEPHVYLLVISDVRREPERNQRNREYVYFTFWKVCLLDNWGSCRTLTTMNTDSVAALLIFSLWIFWYLIFIYCEI